MAAMVKSKWKVDYFPAALSLWQNLNMLNDGLAYLRKWMMGGELPDAVGLLVRILVGIFG